MLYFPMEIHLRIELISILTWQIGWIKDRIRLPSITIPICPISLKTTLFSLHLWCLKILISFFLRWIILALWIEIGIFSCTDPIFRLNKIRFTTQAGWEVCIYVLPYLWLEAALDLSMRASLVILKPVVARPLRLTPRLGFLNASLVILAYVFACRLSALSLGMNPPYPGMCPDRGYKESWIRWDDTGLWWCA